ncbi:hypothetical protein PG987_016617 [Apiospora arundinis]
MTTLQQDLLPPEYVLRVCLPVYPWYKVEAEVATIQFVRERTTIPAPPVYVYDSSSGNALGYEWILMGKVSGEPFLNVRDSFSLEELKSVAQTVAEWSDQLSRLRFFDGIGSLYLDHSKRAIQPGRPVCQDFMADWRHDYSFRRGPFWNMHEFVRSFIDCDGAELHDPRQRLRGDLDEEYDKILELKQMIKAEQDQNKTQELLLRLQQLEQQYSERLALPEIKNSAVDFETYRYRSRSCKEATNLARLGELVDKCFPKEILPPGPVVLEHWDMSEGNVMVDPTSKNATGLIDWEQLHAVPFSLISTRYPSIMQRDNGFPDLPEPPTPSVDTLTLGDDDGEDDYVSEKSFDEIFWENQVMREAFDQRLRELGSPWLQVGQDSKDEAGGVGRRTMVYDIGDNNLCSRCMKYHPDMVENAEAQRELHELVRSGGNYCVGRLEKIESFLARDV